MNAETVEDGIGKFQKMYATEFQAQRGAFGRLGTWLWRFARSEMRPEVHQDWLIVRHFADRAAAYVAASPSSDPTDGRDHLRIVTVAKALACLEAAANETDFASAWLYVNSADSLLPLVVPPEDLDALVTRLGAWDGELPPEGRAVLDSSEALSRVKELKGGKSPASGGPPASALGQPAQGNPPTTAPPPGAQPASDLDGLRTALHRLQQVRSQVWNEANHKIAFMGDLWRWAGFGVLLTLGMAIAIAEAFVAVTPGDQGMRLRFLSAAILGFFGGALSAFLQAREVVVAISKYQLLVIHAVLRMLIGAAGAFVVVLSILALPLGELSALVSLNVLAFLFVGIAAGFSERLFIDTLEKAALNLSTVSKLGDESSVGNVVRKRVRG